MTRWPSLRAASANARPKPEETPVMRNVFAMMDAFESRRLPAQHRPVD
jgi:hypothetical protein